jgi:hypothetical protein
LYRLQILDKLALLPPLLLLLLPLLLLLLPLLLLLLMLLVSDALFKPPWSPGIWIVRLVPSWCCYHRCILPFHSLLLLLLLLTWSMLVLQVS